MLAAAVGDALPEPERTRPRTLLADRGDPSVSRSFDGQTREPGARRRVLHGRAAARHGHPRARVCRGRVRRDVREAPSTSPGGSLEELERETLGYDHAEIGARMAEAWELPESLIEAIAGHHEPYRRCAGSGRGSGSTDSTPTDPILSRVSAASAARAERSRRWTWIR